MKKVKITGKEREGRKGRGRGADVRQIVGLPCFDVLTGIKIVKNEES